MARKKSSGFYFLALIAAVVVIHFGQLVRWTGEASKKHTKNRALESEFWLRPENEEEPQQQQQQQPKQKHRKRHERQTNEIKNSQIKQGKQNDQKKGHQHNQNKKDKHDKVENTLDSTNDVMQRYIKQHSQETLLKELEGCKKDGISPKDCFHHRKFSVAYYSCPNQAGNRIHHFLNGVGWSVITNRTVLWKYYTKDVCLDIGRAHAPEICDQANTKKDCDEVLTLADWIPSHDEWTKLLNLPEVKLVPYWSTHMPPGEVDTRKEFSRLRHPWHEGDEKFAGVDKNETRLVRFGQMHSREMRFFKNEECRNYLLHKEESRIVAEALLEHGAAALYGRLFHTSWSFTPAVAPPQQLIQDTKTTFTVSLHSRHHSAKDTGSNIEPEVKCLEEVLKGIDGNCAVYVMSDRKDTLAQVSKYVKKKHRCKTVVAPHAEGKGLHEEHGPFAGIGFFQDLALASQGRHAFVGHSRSSSLLLEELMDYGRIREGGRSDLKLLKCELPSKHKAK